MFGVFSILYAVVLFLDAVVILDNRRVLTCLRLPLDKEHRATLSPIRRRLVEMIVGVRTVVEFPLLFLNCLYIIYELFMG
ncbi:hypothetical protein ECANGB1_2795 [Enterospora canceri]|uniref:Uncharacterized protein n=1 Tax=Enterospora canceri TaxID=1081671 RepID=A0A1Y1S7X0_9MICR|nr:hypothetical protein ECANGB1_2795 [Enterospora canceri]